MSTKLKQSRNGYASQISSAIGKLNVQLSSPEFDIEYVEYLISRLDSYLNSIEEITEKLCEINRDEENCQEHYEYLTTQRFKIHQVKKSVDLVRPASRNPAATYAPSQLSESNHSYHSLQEKRIKTEAAKRTLLEAEHEVRKAQLDERLEKELFDLMSANEKFMEKVSTEIDQLTTTQKPYTSSPKTDLPKSILKNQPRRRVAVDQFIDELIEGHETELAVPDQMQLSSLLVIRHEFESRSLPTIELTKFNGDSSQWPEFITNFKNRVHMKSTFTDDLRMERLLSCLQGEAASAIAAIGTSGLFYAIALKTLKRDFGNPAVVSHLKLKSLLEKPQIGVNDRISLRQYQQQLKSTVTWLQSIGNSSYLSSTDVLTKAVMRLPNRLRQSFFKSTRKQSFEETTLGQFESWLSDQMLEYFNPIANLISSQEEESKNRKKNSNRDSNRNNSLPRQINANSYQNGGVEKSRVKCWLCSNSHRLQECPDFLTKKANERKDIIIKLKLCWNCLSNNHFSKDCGSRNRCRVDQCNRRHHTLLHYCPERTPQNTSEQHPSPVNQQSQATSNPQVSEQVTTLYTDLSANVGQSKPSKALLQVIPMLVSNGEKTFAVNALLDCGSDTTLIRRDLADALDLQGKSEAIQISNVMSKTKQVKSRKVNFLVSTSSHPKNIEINNAWVVEQLNITSQTVSMAELKQRYRHLRDISVECPKTEDVAVLIGADMPELLLHLDFRRGMENEPIAVCTKLGWVLFGGGNSSTTISSNFLQNNPESLHQSVERFWSTESYGTSKRHDTVLMSSLEKRAMNILEESALKKDGQYHIGMLWSHENTCLPYNRSLAVKRLQSIERKLEKNPELSIMYHDAINDYITRDHARKLSSEEATQTTPKTNYVPHHCVINPNKPGKVRVVFDAAAKFANTSLNSNLLVGPDLLNNLISVLLQFRSGKVAMMADIEQMFNQIKVHPPDQDSLRFLWRDEPTNEIAEYVMTVHLFGKRDSPTVANYALKRSGLDESDNFGSKVVEAIDQDFYMDDYLGSHDSDEEAVKTATDLINCLSKSHFRLTKWISNSKVVMKSLPTSELSKQVVNLDLSNLPVERTLGIIWDPNTDMIRISTINKTFPNTKRGVLSLVSSIFDPLGLVTPSVLEPKLIIQELWRRKVDWDEPLPADLLKRFERWKSTISSISEVSVKRWYGGEQSSDQELHVFADASDKAFGAVSYLKIQSSSTISVNFVMAKSRLAPIKGPLTTPKLELQAAVIATRLKDSILQRLTIREKCIFFWSDSQTVLKYIKNEHRRFAKFVMHRVNEIRLNSPEDSWKFVPGLDNPGDHCTRYTKFSDLQILKNWLDGPEFLRQSDFDYDSFNDSQSDVSSDEIDEEPDVNISALTHDTLQDVLNWKRFSSFTRLVRTIAWILRFKNQWISKHRNFHHSNETSDQLSTQDIQHAITSLCRLAQLETFQSASSKIISDSNLIPLRPTISSDELLRVGGRLKNANISVDEKYQIILPQKHPLSKLIIQHYHTTNFHAGREHTLSLLRQRYWVIKAKSVVRKVIRECLYCERRRATPTSPVMSDLPYERLATNQPPFTYTGVDYFGPMVVKLSKQTRSNQRTSKRWGVLFTCLTVRAIHLELANDLSTDSFLLASRRFCSRRGKPKVFWSDNGTNFIGASGELKEAIKDLDNKRISEKLTKYDIEWKFNPPSSPWMGGAWESLVKIAKRALKTVITDRLLTDEALTTFLCEVESMVNSRPLTPISDDPDDFQALTPNHFLMGAYDNVSPGSFVENDLQSRQKWRKVQAATNIYWKRFITQYLPSLTSRTKWSKSSNDTKIKVGDLVLVMDDNASRGSWPLARVDEVYAGRDNVVRTVLLKTTKGQLKRPVRRLCILENARNEN